MTDERWNAVMKSGADDNPLELTPEEIEAGWHFCHDWDGLLVGPGMVEEGACTCEVKRPEVQPEQTANPYDYD